MTKRKKKSRRKLSAAPSSMHHVERLGLIALGVTFYVHCTHFTFVQDDSFITFRYVRNILEGNGLVFNLGEHVEGYTNFLWTLLLAFSGLLGIDLIDVAHGLGILSGLASLYVLYLLSKTVSGAGDAFLVPLIAIALTVSNSSIAYWTISGMETPLFMLLLVASALAYIRESRESKKFFLTPVLLLFLSLTRPEGMMVYGLTFLHFIAVVFVKHKRFPSDELKRLLPMVAFYALPLLIFVGWRLMYYGYPFPNTYYAKAGLSQEYLTAGINYFVLFAKTYMLHGILIVVPLAILLWRRRSPDIIYLILLCTGYTLYIIIVGGDVLHAFRFFVPILPLLYVLLQEALRELVAFTANPSTLTRAVPIAVGIILGYLTFSTPFDYVREKWMLELGLVSKMTATGQWLNTQSTASTVVAASTIGALSYYSGVTLIDMLGLTDATIAHQPEIVEGIQSGWKERKYNNTYLLSRQPDYIFFSTGSKPSAFAERALFTEDEFRRFYYPCYFHLSGDMNSVNVAYKRSPVILVDTTTYFTAIRDVSFINHFYNGMNARRAPAEAISYFRRSAETGPADFALVHEEIGDMLHAQQNAAAAEKSYSRAVAINPAMIRSQIMLGLYAREESDLGAARNHFSAVVRYNPEYTIGWTLLAESYAMTGDTLQAADNYRRALEVAPNNPHARGFLARASRR
ncbi:MAG: tetratricopeptide repeat protein [Bacteroidetes bacterium]|nr:tetratricopeptide repeat protein [Bacteroidota bacterium]